MSNTRRVTLELLRHGPAHNQLLSPLTQYLALCGNHQGETISVPYEHNQFLARHKSLMYEDSLERRDGVRETRELQLQLTAQEMSTILKKIPGLISELRPSGNADEFIHLEVILSASELSLLPFELATAPNGFPGAGQSLTLQTQSPLSLTRKSRRSNNEYVRWTERPRILFVESLPEADAQKLVPAHLLALRKALAPWLRQDGNDPKNPRLSGGDEGIPSNLERMLTILPRASVEDLIGELGHQKYTHVHILAHGKTMREGLDDRFGLEFFTDQHTTPDVVSGSRLASLIKSQASDGHKMHCPTVISIASCYGSHGGSVVGAGSSVAHHLHEAGVPLVISSHFPLSFNASVILTERLYEELLWGQDPRHTLHTLRRHIHVTLPETHDWASLVAYASFPEDFNKQLLEFKILQCRSSIQAAFSYSDGYASRWRSWYDGYEDLLSITPDQAEKRTIRRELKKFDLSDTALIHLVRNKIAIGKQRIKDILERVKPKRGKIEWISETELARIYGLLATTERREAELHWIEQRISDWLSDDPHDFQTTRTPAEAIRSTALVKSQRYYRKAYELQPQSSWALVQWLVYETLEALTRVDANSCPNDLDDPDLAWKEVSTDRRRELCWRIWSQNLQKLMTMWELANATLEVQSESEDRRLRRLAVSNQIDLKLLSMVFWDEYFGKEKGPTSTQVESRFNSIRKELAVLVDRLINLCGETDWEIVSRRRQLLRYINWFFFYDYEFVAFEGRYKNFPDDLIGLIKLLARETLNALPEHTPQEESDC